MQMRGIDWLPPKLVERMRERRGRLNVFESRVANRTALVVIDMTVLFADESRETLDAVGNINRLAAAVRAGGGPVAWVRPISSPYRDLEDAILGKAAMDRYREAERDG